MTRALDGEHYCKEHQGNHSHYDPENCTVCKLRELLRDAHGYIVNVSTELGNPARNGAMRLRDRIDAELKDKP